MCLRRNMQTAPNSRTQKFIAVGAVLALALISLQAYTLMTDGTFDAAGIQKVGGSTDPPTNGTISVTGSGQVEIQPTMAILTIGVNTQDPSAQTAAQQNANIMTNVISALENLGINSSSIQTVSYSINPQINYDANGKSSVAGYQVDSQVQVTITTPTTTSQAEVQLGTKVGSAIDAAVGQGANEVYGVQFTASNSAVQQADQQALQLAVQDDVQPGEVDRDSARRDRNRCHLGQHEPILYSLPRDPGRHSIRIEPDSHSRTPVAHRLRHSTGRLHDQLAPPVGAPLFFFRKVTVITKVDRPDARP